jgi:apolipoprotein D and lipocalin family protein
VIQPTVNKLLTALALAALLLAGCTDIPEGVTVVRGFELDRYLGTWYEIARLDHSFERGLNNVTATYSMREDGGVRVLNRGYNPARQKWKEAEGKAYFIDQPDVGRLKVSFFGPFYGGYNIIELDKEQYSYVLLCGPDRDYLWILARSPSLPRATVERLVQRAGQLGFQTDQLIYVQHQQPPPQDG